MILKRTKKDTHYMGEWRVDTIPISGQIIVICSLWKINIRIRSYWKQKTEELLLMDFMFYLINSKWENIINLLHYSLCSYIATDEKKINDKVLVFHFSHSNIIIEWSCFIKSLSKQIHCIKLSMNSCYHNIIKMIVEFS